VTDRTIQPLRLCTAALALVIASSAAKASADPGRSTNIPDSAPISDEPPPSELPLPYESWAGTGFAPPKPLPPLDRPLPLARARQRPRRPLEFTAALATFLPSCGSGSIDDRACLTVGPGVGLEGALLYRVSPFFAFGLEGAWSGFGGRGQGALSSAGGGARFLGAAGRVYFADEGRWDPYVALTLGLGSLELSGADGAAHVATSGFGGRVAGGVDFVLGSHLRLGPAVSFTRWLAWSEERCQGDVCSRGPALYGHVIGFATLGFRVTASFGDVL
jgi:hypothetical protein